MSNPKRFRVEILFSPGATAPPLHLDETVRDSDATRFDTAPLQVVGRDDLTCAELEQFFAEAIADGKADDDSEEVVSSTTGVAPPNPQCLAKASSDVVPPPAWSSFNSNTAVSNKDQQLLGGDVKAVTPQQDDASVASSC